MSAEIDSLHASIEASVLELQADNKRLRALIAETRLSKDFRPLCPWCRASFASRIEEKHRDDCPAFTPDGEVK